MMRPLLWGDFFWDSFPKLRYMNISTTIFFSEMFWISVISCLPPSCVAKMWCEIWTASPGPQDDQCSNMSLLVLPESGHEWDHEQPVQFREIHSEIAPGHIQNARCHWLPFEITTHFSCPNNSQWTWVWGNSRDGEGQGRPACCSPQGHKGLDTT